MTKDNLLEIKKLTAYVENKQVLKDIDLRIAKGEVVVIFGPNGSGKTSLLKTILGIGGIKIKSGTVSFKGKILNKLAINKRAELGISLMFQKPPKISGIKLSSILDRLNPNIDFIKGATEKLNCSKFINRDLNSNLSGGEAKRSELVQLVCQNADLFLFDEPDSGVDVDNIKIIGNEIKKLTKVKEKGAIIITHNGDILDYISAHTAYVLINGKIVCEGSPSRIWRDIKRKGYEKYKH